MDSGCGQLNAVSPPKQNILAEREVVAQKGGFFPIGPLIYPCMPALAAGIMTSYASAQYIGGLWFYDLLCLSTIHRGSVVL